MQLLTDKNETMYIKKIKNIIDLWHHKLLKMQPFIKFNKYGYINIRHNISRIYLWSFTPVQAKPL